MKRPALLSPFLYLFAFSSLAHGDVTAASGVNIHFTDPKPGEMEMMREAGFKIVRMDLTWSSTEKVAGEYDFSAYDRLTAHLEANGMTPYYILDYSNAIYEENRAVRTAKGRAAFTKWALAAVERFQGRNVRWEIWNEPNISGFWKPEPNVAEYTALALEASQAIKAKFPGEHVCGPALAGMDFPFLEGCLKAGLLEFWDSVSVHPYRQEGPESVARDYNTIRQLIAKYAPEGKSIPVIAGEWGFSSAWKNHDDESQGRMLARQWLSNSWQGIPVSIWYDWHDDGSDPAEFEHNFGTVEFEYRGDSTPVYQPKPSYLAAKHFNQTLAGFTFERRLALGASERFGLLFQKGDERILALWTTSAQPFAGNIPCDEGEFTVTSHTGATLPALRAGKEGLAVSLTHSPVYVKLSGPNRSLEAIPDALDLTLSLIPGSNGSFAVRLTSQEEKAKEIRVRLTGLPSEGPGVEPISVVLEPGDEQNPVVFPAALSAETSGPIGVEVETGGAVVTTLAPRHLAPPLAKEIDLAVHWEGDAEGKSEAHIEKMPEPCPLPTGPEAGWILDYHFADGWQYAVTTVSAGAAPVLSAPAGTSPRKVIFSLWINGNGSSLSPRMRLVDARGVTWQPSGPPITWTGWRHVEMELSPETAHWGGPEGETNPSPAFPLKLETPFLLDNPSRKTNGGGLSFTLPRIVFEE